LTTITAFNCSAALALAAVLACSPGPDRGVPAHTASANGQLPSTVASKAVQFGRVDLNACLTIARKERQPSEALCPGFISDGLVQLIAMCADAGGRVEPMPRPLLQSLDVDGDGNDEFLYDTTENYQCGGAPSALSCGSLGCPVSLFERRTGAWISIGSMSATDAPSAEVLMPEAGDRYSVLRGGCSGERPCDELTYYRWQGTWYQGTTIEVRRHWVDVANDGLWTLVDDTNVLAEPSSSAAVLERYASGTQVVVIGDARDAPYKYVSPCNSCRSGFVDAAGLRRTN
jgi:hypothetical protein